MANRRDVDIAMHCAIKGMGYFQVRPIQERVLKSGFHTRGGGWCRNMGFPPPPPPRIYNNIIVYQLQWYTTINTLKTYSSIYSLNTFKISSKPTLFIYGPSIAIHISLFRLVSFKQLWNFHFLKQKSCLEPWKFFLTSRDTFVSLPTRIGKSFC